MNRYLLFICLQIAACESEQQAYPMYYHLKRDCNLMATEYLRVHGVIDNALKAQIRKYLMSYHNMAAARLLDELERNNFQFIEKQ